MFIKSKVYKFFRAAATIAHLFLAASMCHGATLIDEGFDYSTGGLSGNNGGTGFSGSWSTVKTAPTVASPGLSWGSLNVVGNSVSDSTGGGGARNIGTSSVLSSNGLMSNGSTLWFSVIIGLGSDTVANADFNFSLGTDGFANYGAGEFAQRVNLNSGEGIGFALSNVNATTGRIQGAYWQDTADADTYANRTMSTTSTTLNQNSSMLIVGRIDWGADDLAAETLTLYAPDTSLNLGTAILASTSLTALDQSAFDTVAFELKGGAIIDEIRFGANYTDVLVVPEPNFLALLGISCLVLLHHRRRP